MPTYTALPRSLQMQRPAKTGAERTLSVALQSGSVARVPSARGLRKNAAIEPLADSFRVEKKSPVRYCYPIVGKQSETAAKTNRWIVSELVVLRNQLGLGAGTPDVRMRNGTTGQYFPDEALRSESLQDCGPA